MIFNYAIEAKLGLRYYTGQGSSSSGGSVGNSMNESSGASSSSSTAQLTPQQLVSLYNIALPQMLNTTAAGAKSVNPLAQGSPALDAANQGAVAGVNAINLNGLSPGEAASVERSTNQQNLATGNLGNSNAMNTIGNAMNFGGAFNNKIGLMNNSTNAAASAANAGSGAANALSTSLGTVGGLFNPVASNANTANSKSSSTFGSLGTSGTVANNSSDSLGGGVSCCFIFLESYGGMMPSYVRECRDVYYDRFPSIASGYKKMAKWLVPLMKGSALVRSFVWHWMVKPLTEHGAFVKGREEGKSHKTLRKVWFTIWHLTGK